MFKKLINLIKKIDNGINTFSEGLFIYSELLLRIFLGIAFIIHGYNKFPLPPATLIKYFGFSPHLASFVAISEVLAGILIILSRFINSFLYLQKRYCFCNYKKYTKITKQLPERVSVKSDFDETLLNFS